MSQATFSVADIRKSFLDFFASKGHTVVASSPLVPGNDPTLMFTNSGMVQFKDVFLGADKRSYVRAASVQACLRAGGKHNDLENVGYTARHHTFFEMLGNWSFGDYFKRDSLKWGWELLTQVYKLPADKLMVTVYIDDDEAYDIWHKEIGLPADRIVRIGDNKGKKYASDNFWMMADTGPCGPCSEIFYDHGAHIPGGPPGSPDEDGDRFIEIWNHVFMQFDMQPDGSLVKLPAPCVDTGMGLERLAAILQHVHSNYEIDIFDALIKAASRETGEKDLNNKSLRVIADHIRATAFLVSDGVVPSNEGRGYVQRRIIRRAIRHGYLLGKKTPFFHKLVADLVVLMGDAYPRLKTDEKRITEILKIEEERFFETLASGMDILDSALAGGAKVLPGEVAFKLHDTYGFPLDLSADVCRERGLSVDEAGFAAAMDKQKSQARAAGKFKMDRALDYSGEGHAFTGYELLEESAKVVALYAEGVAVPALQAGQNGVVVLSTTPFYAESGGQVGDSGTLTFEDGTLLQVTDTKKENNLFIHFTDTIPNVIGEKVKAQVAIAHRKNTTLHHSATHLLHAALRDVLGKHVAQKGSLVNAEQLRFDFSHFAKMTPEEINAVSVLVNEKIKANIPVVINEMDKADAIQLGAMALFGEKYGDKVRVVVMDPNYSIELCGGTHVGHTGEIGHFILKAEASVAAGVRRIEGVVGEAAELFLNEVKEKLHKQIIQLAEACESIASKINAQFKAPDWNENTSTDVLNDTIASLQTSQKELSKKLESQEALLVNELFEKYSTAFTTVNDIQFLGVQLQLGSADHLKKLAQQLGALHANSVVVLTSKVADKANVVLAISESLVNQKNWQAPQIIKEKIAPLIKGGGGGQKTIASAGGQDNTQLDKVIDVIKAML
jgi:alanyl-tRNA synthetase